MYLKFEMDCVKIILVKKQYRRLIMQYLGLFFTFTFPGILVGILLAASKFFEADR